MGQGISAALADEIAIQQKPRALRRRSSIGRNGEEEEEEGSFVSCFSDEETGLSRKSIRPIYININHRKPLDPPCTVSAARVPSDPPYFRDKYLDEEEARYNRDPDDQQSVRSDGEDEEAGHTVKSVQFVNNNQQSSSKEDSVKSDGNKTEPSTHSVTEMSEWSSSVRDQALQLLGELNTLLKKAGSTPLSVTKETGANKKVIPVEKKEDKDATTNSISINKAETEAQNKATNGNENDDLDHQPKKECDDLDQQKKEFIAKPRFVFDDDESNKSGKSNNNTASDNNGDNDIDLDASGRKQKASISSMNSHDKFFAMVAKGEIKPQRMADHSASSHSLRSINSNNSTNLNNLNSTNHTARSARSDDSSHHDAPINIFQDSASTMPDLVKHSGHQSRNIMDESASSFADERDLDKRLSQSLIALSGGAFQHDRVSTLAPRVSVKVLEVEEEEEEEKVPETDEVEPDPAPGRKARKPANRQKRGSMAAVSRAMRQSVRFLTGQKKPEKSKIKRTMRRQSVATFNPDKKKNRILRWNLLWAFIVFAIIFGLGLAPLWMDKIVGCQISWYFTASIYTLMDIIFLISAVLAWPNLYREVLEFFHTDHSNRYLQKTELTPTGQVINRHQLDPEVDPAKGLPKLAHLVVMTGYKEPVDLICATLDTVANQTRAKSIIMVIGLEERTDNYEEKMEFFRNRYEKSFFKLIQTVHPYGLKGEIAGTCSNANWAVRESTTMLRDMGTPLDPEMTLLTKLDTDTMFLPTHFDVLGREFMRLPKNKRLDTMYQSVLSFNLSLDERWFFTRVTGILRTFFILGFLIPYNISAMSIYSMPLSLARRGNYWLPHYQMEDVIQNLNLMSSLRQRVPIQLIPLPTISGPTSGENFFKELHEWRWQARRWTVGSAEVFHYYMVKFLGCKFPFWAGLNYGLCYILYYGFILCVIGLYQFVASIAVLFDSCNQDQTSLLYPILQGLKYTVVFGTAFLADHIHRQIIGVDEKKLQGLWGWIRSIFHWLSAPWVLLAYNIVEAMAIIELCYYGRDICGHDASEKTALTVVEGKEKEGEKKERPHELVAQITGGEGAIEHTRRYSLMTGPMKAQGVSA